MWYGTVPCGLIDLNAYISGIMYYSGLKYSDGTVLYKCVCMQNNTYDTSFTPLHPIIYN